MPPKHSSRSGSWRRRLRQRRRRMWDGLQPWLIEPALWLLPRLSRKAIWSLGGRLGRLAYLLDRRGRRIAAANLQLVYGERLSARRRRALIRIAYRHAARTLLDVFWFSRHRQERLRQWCRIEPAALESVRVGPGILVGAHLGNWEIAGQALAERGIALTSVAKPVGSKQTTAALKRAREATGQEIVFARGAVRVLVRALRQGRIVAIIQDQHTDTRDGGIFVDFMGLPATVSNAAALLSQRLQVPVIAGCCCLRDARGHYRCTLTAILKGAPEEDVAAFTQRITEVLVTVIRRHPGQWLWMYKRWKRVPPGVAGDRYPFYARRTVQSGGPA